MDRSVFIVARRKWLLESEPKRIASQDLCPVGRTIGHLQDGCNLLVKFRDPKTGSLVADDTGHVLKIKDSYYIKCGKLCAAINDPAALHNDVVAFFLEGTGTEARCVIDQWEERFLEEAERSDPMVRLGAYDLPPATATLVDAPQVVAALYRLAALREQELFGVYASRFLDTPHIVTALFAHLFSIRTDDNIRFPIQVKKLAEQLRTLLLACDPKIVCIRAIKKSHVELWAEAQGQRFSFLDGGVARIPGMPGLQPMGLRVGVYSVRPGIAQPEEREQWTMTPYVLGDLIDRSRPTRERPEPRRFFEAGRYTLEPLTALLHLRKQSSTRALFLHGPLVNQFAQYDEGEPNFLPFIEPAFLRKVGIEREEVERQISDLPADGKGVAMWNQFMAIYGFIMKQIDECATPIVGVVERPTGRSITLAVLWRLQEAGVVRANYVEKVKGILEQYDITDDFLFGCILREGEYITPVQVRKNEQHRARLLWQPVLKRYPQPFALLLKSEDANFPFRAELNKAAATDFEFIGKFLYHTARLLPRYAFPVGLDIVDKYAKVPDWISRGISTEMSASILRRAMKTGDAHVVAQIRLLLAKGPRDFFFRPSARIL